MDKPKEGDRVAWDWATGTALGTVKEIHTETVERTLKGTDVVRHGTDDDPALYIEQDDGDGVLKLASEVRRA